jgi:hypothetical protein
MPTQPFSGNKPLRRPDHEEKPEVKAGYIHMPQTRKSPKSVLVRGTFPVLRNKTGAGRQWQTANMVVRFFHPDFETKAGRILDLYQRLWKGRKLATDEFVLSADEKTSIQARCRKAASLPAQPGQPMKVEHEYERLGAWAYLAALDVHQAKLFGRCEAKTGIVPFDRLVDQVMQQHPYRRAGRVFWIVDNGSSHRGPRAVQRLQGKYPNLVLVHGPVHASWLNQIEIYFSIIQRKVLTPNDFSSRQELADRLLAFERRYETIARPFEWRFTRQDLTRLLRRLGHPAVKAA